MKKRLLFWLPRILGIIFALFISIFALDVFGEGYSFWETLFAFLMHLVPTFISILALLIGWRWELAGGIIYTGLAALYVILMNDQDWISCMLIGGPLLVIGILFIISVAHPKQSKIH